MKKTTIILSVLSVLFLSIISAGASESDNKSVSIGLDEEEIIEQLEDSSIIEHIEENSMESFAVDDNDTEKYTGLEFDTEKAYCIYYNGTGLFEEGTSLSDYFSEYYIWEIPINNSEGECVLTATFTTSEDGEWDLQSYGKTGDEYEVFSDYDSIMQIITENGIDTNDITEIKSICIHGTNALYVICSDAEYIIPVTIHELATGDMLVQNQAYEASEFMSIITEAMSDYFSSDTEDESDSEVLYSGFSTNSSEVSSSVFSGSSLYLIAAIAVVSAAALTGLIFVVIKKRKARIPEKIQSAGIEG